MRRSPIDPNGPRRDAPRSRPILRGLAGLLTLLAAMADPAAVRAQEEPTASGLAAPGATPLAKYFARDGLVIYLEFSGLDEHTNAWTKTAAYKILTETPMGDMLESVATQLLDKALSYTPNRSVTGQQIVAQLKHAVHHGFALGLHLRAYNTPDQRRDSIQTTLVVRGATAKEARSTWAPFLRLINGTAKPQLDTRQGRTVVALPLFMPDGSEVKGGGRCWWAEGEDLVFALPHPTATDKIMAALDGKTPNALEHPLVRESMERRGTFEPVGLFFVDFEHVPKTAQPVFPQLTLAGPVGIKRFVMRYGFDGDALMTELQIVAPKPRNALLAIFDQPTFNSRSLMPMPEGVESFYELSANPASLLEGLGKLGPVGAALAAQVDELGSSVEAVGKLDFKKDFLGHLGPKIGVFVSRDESAKVEVEPSGSEASSSLLAMLGLSNPQRLTVVAQVSDPKKFARTLEGVVNAVNHELIERTNELSEKEESEKNEQPGGPGGGRRGEAGGNRRSTRKRSSSSQAPQFRSMPGADLTQPSYMLQTPSSSPLRLGPSNFHPVIKLDGDYLVVSGSRDAADKALKAVKQKGGSSPEDLRRVTDQLPEGMVFVAAMDPRGKLPEILASLPANLQTTINSAISTAAAKPAGGGPGGASGL
ncbi:MAG: hypothetical protein ACYC61_30530, partial [Isosphaeraceae bacterium]